MSRIIKRYENRKLYDSEAGKYISLHGISELIRSGENVQVIENNSGEDITEQTLTQIILEEGKKGNNPFTSQLLHEAIRLGEVIDEGVERFKEQVDEWLPESVQHWWKSENRNEVTQLKERVNHLENLLDELYKSREEDEPGSPDKGIDSK